MPPHRCRTEYEKDSAYPLEEGSPYPVHACLFLQKLLVRNKARKIAGFVSELKALKIKAFFNSWCEWGDLNPQAFAGGF